MTENGSNAEKYRFADFELNSSERILFQDGRRVPLTPRAFDLLLALVRADGHLVSKEALLDEVWADAVVEEGNLNRTISSLRKALGDVKRNSKFIETVPKSGYRFIGRLETGRPLNRQTVEIVEPLLSRGRRRPYWMMAAGAFVVLFGTLVATFFFVPRRGADAAPAGGMHRLTTNEFDEDMASWTSDGQIRFIRFVTATRGESWVMNADGSNQRRANEQIKSLVTGNWSGDDKQVVFVKEGEGPRNIYLANSDGSGERKLPLSYPPNDWSPDGKKLLYTSSISAEDLDIFVYDIESGKSVNITNNGAFDADPLFSADGSQVTFVSSRDGNKEDYLMNADGSNVRRMTDHPATDAFPLLSPDGTQMVFDSNRVGENTDIYLKNVNDDLPPVKITDLPSNEEHRGHCWSPDGTKMVITSDRSGKSNVYVTDVEPYAAQVILSDDSADLQYPSFSRDASKLVYQARTDDGRFAIRLHDMDEKSDRNVFSTETNVANLALSPVFSPDGLRVAFTNKTGGNSEIFTMNLDGTGLVNLTNNDASDSTPVYSSDGREIYFQSNRDGSFETFHLFRMNADGTEPRRITTKSGYEFWPAVVPNGPKLVFSGDRVDQASKALDIRLLDLDSPGDEKVIAAMRFHDTQPAVSPEGKRIAFVAQSDGNSEIYLMMLDGSRLLRLTRNPASDRSPVFSSDGTRLYFESDRDGRSAVYAMDLPY